MNKYVLFCAVALTFSGVVSSAPAADAMVAAGPLAPAAASASATAPKPAPVLPIGQAKTDPAPAPASSTPVPSLNTSGAMSCQAGCAVKPELTHKSLPKKPRRTADARTADTSINPGAPARDALKKSEAWATDAKAMPAMGDDGRVVFTYGQSVPTVVCSPLRVCDIELEPGEMVIDKPHAGDAVRWSIEPVITGAGATKTVHLAVKPKDVDLDTNLIIPTDRRAYYVRLVSSDTRYVTRVSWYYPENEAKAWAAQRATMEKAEASVVSDLPPLSVDKLNFKYAVDTVKGSPRFVPVRVFDDGGKTYFQMPATMKVDEAPGVVLVGKDGKDKLVNFRVKNGYFILDRLFDKAALFAGVGSSQDRVEITRDTCQKRGWFNSCETE